MGSYPILGGATDSGLTMGTNPAQDTRATRNTPAPASRNTPPPASRNTPAPASRNTPPPATRDTPVPDATGIPVPDATGDPVLDTGTGPVQGGQSAGSPTAARKPGARHAGKHGRPARRPWDRKDKDGEQ
jgi:hypothetical protein